MLFSIILEFGRTKIFFHPSGFIVLEKTSSISNRTNTPMGTNVLLEIDLRLKRLLSLTTVSLPQITFEAVAEVMFY